jgi:hypothetical protein
LKRFLKRVSNCWCVCTGVYQRRRCRKFKVCVQVPNTVHIVTEPVAKNNFSYDTLLIFFVFLAGTFCVVLSLVFFLPWCGGRSHFKTPVRIIQQLRFAQRFRLWRTLLVTSVSYRLLPNPKHLCRLHLEHMLRRAPASCREKRPQHLDSATHVRGS